MLNIGRGQGLKENRTWPSTDRNEAGLSPSENPRGHALVHGGSDFSTLHDNRITVGGRADGEPSRQKPDLEIGIA